MTDVLNRDDNGIFFLLYSDAFPYRSCRDTRLDRPELVVGRVSSHGFGSWSSPDLISACTVASLLGSLCFEHLQTHPLGPFFISLLGMNSGRWPSITANPVNKHVLQ